jgi:hypothetical protein
MIYYRLGDEVNARKYLKSALATNPHFHLLFADEAARILKTLESRTDSAALRR